MESYEFQKLLRGPVANIYVGREKVRFTLPKDLACRQCSFFKEHFGEHLEDAQDTALDLPEEYPETFARLVQWIYQEKLPPATTDDDGETYINFHSHLTFYYLASRFKTPRLQNEIMQRLGTLYIAMRHDYPFTPYDIIEIYQITKNKSALRQFVCDAAAKEFLDHAKGEGESYEPCLIRIHHFAVQFTDALLEYHLTGMDYIKDCPDRYTVDAEGAA